VIRNIIFDWSGTLVDDLPAVWAATNHVLRRAGRPELTLAEFRAEFVLPFTGFYDKHVAGVPMAQLEEWFHAKFREVQHSVVELPHAREFLEFCRARGVRTLLLSTVHPEHFAVQTRGNGFDAYLDHPCTGVRDKRGKIHELLAAHGLDPAATLFIGDMEHDVETARHGGVGSVAVLTGYNGPAQLRRAGPDLIVEHLGELRARLERHAMRLHPAPDRNGAGPRRRPVLTVGAAVFDPAGRVLMLRTHKWSGKWGIPGGKVEYGEACEEALRRELREETALEVADVRFVLVQDCIGSDEFHREEHFVLLNYACRTATPAAVALNAEAQEFRWVTPAQARALPLNRPTLRLLDALAAAPPAA
jgi:phosphoglycolate phosphatase-like HAD superfamily hydrolase/ADP-ribose pyrophosphatase YjhB (NUDIX family)